MFKYKGMPLSMTCTHINIRLFQCRSSMKLPDQIPVDPPPIQTHSRKSIIIMWVWLTETSMQSIACLIGYSCTDERLCFTSDPSGHQRSVSKSYTQLIILVNFTDNKTFISAVYLLCYLPDHPCHELLHE